MTSSQWSFTRADGGSLHVHQWSPEGPPRAVVHIAHGIGEHAARYARFATALTGLGLVVYAHDQRGHGRSRADGEPYGHWGDGDGFEDCCEDVRGLLAHHAQTHPDLPRVLFGHSGGSLMAQALLARAPHLFDVVALSGTSGPPPPIAAAGRAVAAVEMRRLGPRGESPIIRKLSFDDFNRRFRPNRTEADWLSRDEREVDAYVSDPMCGAPGTVATWRSLLGHLPRLTQAQALANLPRDKPVYLFSGTHDPVGEMGRGVIELVDRYRAAWMTDVTYRLYDGGRHEMLHELNRDEVTEELLAWLRRRLGLA
ncbi:MAG: lysophospholipase [Myxococcota bacterium]